MIGPLQRALWERMGVTNAQPPPPKQGQQGDRPQFRAQNTPHVQDQRSQPQRQMDRTSEGLRQIPGNLDMTRFPKGARPHRSTPFNDVNRARQVDMSTNVRAQSKREDLAARDLMREAMLQQLMRARGNDRGLANRRPVQGMPGWGQELARMHPDPDPRRAGFLSRRFMQQLAQGMSPTMPGLG